jgi:RNA polymerase sigma-70 factor (ECF subfamily)
MNYAAAVAISEGLEKGLALLEQVGASGRLEQYYVFHAARADLLRRLGRSSEAAAAYSNALALTTNQVEQRYIQRRLKEISCFFVDPSGAPQAGSTK